MPIADPIYMRNAAILVKLETAVGTDAVPTTANFMKVKDFTLTPLDGDEIEMEEIRPYFGNFDSEMATSMRSLEMSVYLAGSGTPGTAPNMDPLLQICGASATIAVGVSTTYAPITNAIKAGSIYTNIGGTNYRFVGARGNAALTADAKGYPMVKFSLKGLYLPLVSATLPAVGGTASARAVPVNKANSTLSLHGLALRASAFGIDFGNQYGYRNEIGYEGVDITNRKSTFSATFAAVDVATKNWEALSIAGTKGALAFTHGLVAGNQVAINSAGVNVSKPSISNLDGVKMQGISGRMVPTAAGNDEWSIVFT